MGLLRLLNDYFFKQTEYTNVYIANQTLKYHLVVNGIFIIRNKKTYG